MFSRVTNATHICLRCQLRLHRLRPHAELLSPLARSIQQRHQSAVAVSVDDDISYAEQHTSHPVEATERKGGGSKKRRKNKLSRIWRAQPSAALGIDVLGRPSEVLLLSPRDRKIPVVPKGNDEETKESFYESVASEKQAPTWDQIKENISHARDQLSQRRGALTREAWSKLKQVIVAGFTKRQLQRYLEEGTTKERPSDIRVKVAAGKEPIIKLIAKHVWGYELPTQPAPAIQKTRPSSGIMTLRVPPCSKEKRVAVERSPVANVLEIATQHGVSISFEKQSTTISGSEDSANEVRTALQHQISNTKTSSRRFGGHSELLRTQTGKESIQILAETLALKYGVHAGITGSATKGLQVQVTAAANNETSINRFYHEFQLSMAIHSKKTPNIASVTPAQKVFLTPYSSPEVLNIYPYSKDMYRAQSVSNVPDAPVDLTSEISHKGLFDKSFVKSTDRIQHEYVAELGVTLFHGPKSILPIAKGTEKTSDVANLPSNFVREIPFLPHLLSAARFRQPGTLLSSDPRARLCFKVLSSGESDSVIEVELSADDHKNLLRDPKIRRISLVNSGSSLNLLRPALPVDILMTSRQKVDLYHSDSPRSSRIHTAISSYVEQAFKNVQESYPTLDSVPPARLPLFADLPQDSISQSSSPLETTTEEVSDAKATQKTKYVACLLADFSIIETDRYEFDIRKDQYSLEYVKYIAQNPNVDPNTPAQDYIMPSPFRDRHALVVKKIKPLQKPKSEDKAEKRKGKGKAANQNVQQLADKEKFDGFLPGPLWVAAEIGKIGKRVKQRMEGMK